MDPTHLHHRCRPVRRWVTAIALPALLALAPAAWAQRGAPRIADLDRYIEAARQAWDVPGLSIAIVKDDSVVFAKGYGIRELGRADRVDERTLFAIGSSSKAFTTFALAMLADEGRLKWDDPATKYLPSLELYDPYITRHLSVRDLVTHRVGIQRADQLWYGTPYDRDEVVRRARHAGQLHGFRADFGYNNLMYIAAGQILPAVTGTSWDDFIRQRIFTPLGMRTSGTRNAELRGQPNVAAAHLKTDAGTTVIPWRNLDNAGPAGSIHSSALEMAQWVRLQLNEGSHGGQKLVSAEAAREMHRPQTIMRLSPWPDSPGPVNRLMVPGTNFMMYGLGWFLQDYRGRKVVGHGGSIDGMRAQVALVPEERLGFVILTNLDGGRHTLPEALLFSVLDHYLGGPPRDWSTEMLAGENRVQEGRRQAEARAVASRVEGTRPSLTLDRYVGTYADSLYGELRVEFEGGGLVVRSPAMVGDLRHWHFDTFQLVWREERSGRSLITFVLDARGEPRSIEVPGFGSFGRRAASGRAAVPQ